MKFLYGSIIVLLLTTLVFMLDEAVRPTPKQCIERVGNCVASAYMGCAAGVTVPQCKELYRQCRADYEKCMQWAK